jgi:hypothetical protein
MSAFVMEGYKTVNEAATRGGVLKNQGFDVYISGAVDDVQPVDPAGNDLSWPNAAGQKWFVVIATNVALGKI